MDFLLLPSQSEKENHNFKASQSTILKPISNKNNEYLMTMSFLKKHCFPSRIEK